MTWEVRQGDCLELLKTMPSGSIEAVVTDPPYGMNYKRGGASSKSISSTGKHFTVPIVGDDADFDPSPFLAWPCAFSGAHWFYDRLPVGGSMHCWDKKGEYKRTSFADGDLIWVSVKRKMEVYRNVWRGICRHEEVKARFEHPTQKPVSVMKWMLDLLGVPVGATVLDPFCGSGTTGVACMNTGRNFIGFEIDAGYCEIARKRIADAERARSEKLIGA